MSKIDLHKGDCLEVMGRLIADGVVVDAIITDPPYDNTTKRQIRIHYDRA